MRETYSVFEAGVSFPASEVYLHEMPGGQFTNLRAQAASLGLAERWPEIARTYADVNQMFGDIVKVTPSSKVVGDMALMMVTQNLTRADVENPDKDIAFSTSAINMMRGDLGQPPGGWPKAIQKKILKGETPYTERPGKQLAAIDLEKTRKDLSKEFNNYPVTDEDLNGYLMYPKVFLDYMGRRREYSPVSALPTPVFFYGMEIGQNISIDIDPGKTLELLLLAVSETGDGGNVKVFFELNGHPRTLRVPYRSVQNLAPRRPQAEDGNPSHIGSPMPGHIGIVSVSVGDNIEAGDVLVSIEAMKMETSIHADGTGIVKKVHVEPGSSVDAKDLLVELE